MPPQESGRLFTFSLDHLLHLLSSLKWGEVEVIEGQPSLWLLGSSAEKISRQDKPRASKNVDRFSSYPDNLLPSGSLSPWITLLPEAPAAVTKIMLGSKTVTEDVSLFVVSAGNCEEMIHTEAPLYQFHWHGLEINELESLLPACSLLFRRV